MKVGKKPYKKRQAADAACFYEGKTYLSVKVMYMLLAAPSGASSP
jgi:hypothetical protein